MAIFTRYRDGVAIFTPTREFTVGLRLARPLDLKGRPIDDLGDLLDEHLAAGKRRILLNLEAVNFLDSAGLGELVKCKKRTLEGQGDIKLLNPRDRVRELLVMTRLIQIFEIYDDEDTAVRSFENTSSDV